MAIDRHGGIALVEVKSSLADFRADAKWLSYLDYADRFYFAVAPAFPVAVLLEETGIVADAYEAAILRSAAERPLAAARLKGVAGLAAGRLGGTSDSLQP